MNLKNCFILGVMLTGMQVIESASTWRDVDDDELYDQWSPVMTELNSSSRFISTRQQDKIPLQRQFEDGTINFDDEILHIRQNLSNRQAQAKEIQNERLRQQQIRQNRRPNIDFEDDFVDFAAHSSQLQQPRTTRRTQASSSAYFDTDNFMNVPSSQFSRVAAPTPRHNSALENQVNDLIQQSYILPEMQQAVLYFTQQPFEINIKTGKVEHIWDITSIINHTTDEEQARTNALKAALEAVRIARFAAALDVAYKNPQYILFAPNLTSYLMPPIDEEIRGKLNEYEKTINEHIPSGSLLSFMQVPSSIVNMFTISKHQKQHHHANKLSSNRNIQFVPEDMLDAIVKNYDFKRRISPEDAANLLVKQCFIAQRSTSNTPNPFLHLQTALSESHYIFDDMPNINQMIQEISQALSGKQPTPQQQQQNQWFGQAQRNLPTLSKTQAHQYILQMRKAVQTAIFIANKNSNFYVGYVLPAKITRYLDNVVNHLMNYEERLRKLSKDPAFGATNDDLENDKIWSRFTWIAAGFAFIGGIDFIAGPGTAGKLAGQAVQTGIETGAQAVGTGLYYATVPTAQIAAAGVTGAVQGVSNVAVSTVQAASGVASGIKTGFNNAFNKPAAQ